VKGSYIKLLPQHLSEGTEVNHENFFVMMASLLAKIQAWDLPNMKRGMLAITHGI
jgi:hypothetical protein